jgi:hypothetical protein
MAVDSKSRYQLETQVKAALRLSTDVFDDSELRPMMDACILDLQGAGVDVENNIVLVRQAVVFYCKANFGLEADEKWQRQYEKLRDALGSRTAVTEE